MDDYKPFLFAIVVIIALGTLLAWFYGWLARDTKEYKERWDKFFREKDPHD